MGLSKSKFDNGELDLNHVQEVVTGISAIDDKTVVIESTDRFGQTRDSLPELLKKVGWYNAGSWASNPNLTKPNEYVYFGSQRFVPLSLPYSVDSSTTPDPNALVPSELRDISEIISIDSIRDYSVTRFSTLSEAMNSNVKLGQFIYVEERIATWGGGAYWKVVNAGDATDNGINVVTNSLTNYKLVLDESSSVINVRALGVIPIVGRDNKDALDKAFSKWESIYIPTGNYTSSPLNKISRNVTIYGDGLGLSRLDLAPGAVGVLLDASSVIAKITDVRLFGGLTSTQKSNPTSLAERDGIYWSTQNGSMIERVKVDGFARFGINGADGSNGLWERSTLSNSIVINNWQGVNSGGNAGEYARYSDNDIKSNYFGLAIRSGNMIANGNHIDKNGIGIFLDGRLPNDGHGNVIGGTINHNDIPIFARDIDNGFNFLGNQIFEGTIKIENCTGVMISGGQINVNEFDLDGPGVNYIINNLMFASYGNVINRDIGNGTLIINNFFPDGSYLEGLTSRSIIVNERNAKVSLNGSDSWPSMSFSASRLTSSTCEWSQTASSSCTWDNNNSTKPYVFQSNGADLVTIYSNSTGVELHSPGAGLIAKSPNGTRYKLTPPDGGGAAIWMPV